MLKKSFILNKNVSLFSDILFFDKIMQRRKKYDCTQMSMTRYMIYCTRVKWLSFSFLDTSINSNVHSGELGSWSFIDLPRFFILISFDNSPIFYFMKQHAILNHRRQICHNKLYLTGLLRSKL